MDTNTASASTTENKSSSLPQYQCHKKVSALQITDITANNELVFLTESGFAPVTMDADYMEKHKPVIGGYYVVYEDGYKSFSPADVFEKGYSLIV